MSIRDIIEKRLREQQERDAGSSQFSRDARNAAQGSVVANLLTSAVLSPFKSMSNVSKVSNALDPRGELMGDYFTSQGTQGTLSEERQAALRGESINADSQKDVVLDPNQTNMRYAAEGLNPPDYGVAGTNQVPNKAVIEEAGPNGPVDQMTGRSDDEMTSRSLLRRALESSRTPIDMQRLEQLAQDRKRDGGLSMITSLAAGEAGPRYSDYKENYLKKAMEEKGQQQLGDFGYASGGEFYETPGIQQSRETQADLATARILAPQENTIRAENLLRDKEAIIKAGQIREQTAKTQDQNAFVADALGMLDEIPDNAILRKIGSKVYGFDSYNFEELLATVKANIGFSELNAIRSAIGNKTGGALGNVTERELKFLQQVRGSLDMGQSSEQLRKNLENIQRSYKNVIRALNGEEPVQRGAAGFEINGVPVDDNVGAPPPGAVQLLE